MNTQQTKSINQLVGQFLDLQEQWQDAPESVDWAQLKALALAGADFYNEGRGLSFHIVALDGMAHGEFHLRFLEYSLEAGFDPFKLVRPGSGQTMVPVFAHESLADAAKLNPWSARMQALLRNAARKRFGAIDVDNTRVSSLGIAQIIEACRDSIPADLFEKLAQALAAERGALAACC